VTALRLSRMHFPVTVLGPGRRVGIWTQGCSIHCAGCVSRDTWDPLGGHDAGVDEIVERVDAWEREDGALDGVTISGGEPFDQPEALDTLLAGLDAWRRERGLDGVDLLCYSGYPLARLRSRHAAALARLDAVIPNPFVEARAPGGRWRGSDNQQLVPLTALGREKYDGASAGGAAGPGGIQFVVDDGVWVVGIPQPGDLARVEAMLRDRGILLEGVSWR